MDKFLTKAMLLIAYIIPYVFLALDGDLSGFAMLPYGAMVAAFLGLCWTAIKIGYGSLVYFGNIMSFISSWIAVDSSDLVKMSWYFKPFTAHQLLIIISVVLFVLQALIVWKYKK